MLPEILLLAALLAAALLAAAGLKIVDRTISAVNAGTYGVTGRPARWIWLPLALLETLLAVAVLTGWGPGTWAAAAVLAVFALAEAGALVAGRGGAPCGCFGARGRVSSGSVTRTALLSGAATLLALATTTVPTELRVATSAVAVIAAAIVVARALRTGAPDGALEISDEGPSLGTRIELAGAPAAGLQLAFFSSTDCRLCRGLLAAARDLGASIHDELDDPQDWAAAAVPAAPYAVALAADGTVLAKGLVNTRRQLASVLATARVRSGEAPAPAEPADSRRGFLATATAAAGAIVAARTVGSLIEPDDADAYHICGHTFTTDSCPHPTGLPRIDRRGYPLRGRDGHRVDDLGRPINAEGAPVNRNGAPLLDPDGRALPPTTRTPVCPAAGKRYSIATQTDGTWSRCCDGHVRTIMDCCSTSSRRINGDGSLSGYCYAGRRVFCIVYFQTKIPC
ncbi:MAG: MauE/DoxX family redox-associated membrane protein [Ilumatobacteraceae bacterium]